MRQMALLDVPPSVAPQSSDSDDWFTPSWYYRPLKEEFGFTLDVCATSESAKCERYFDLDDDGLAQSWAGECWWCFPPPSELDAWIEKAWAEMHGCPAGVMLVPAWTERSWWQEHVEPFRDVTPHDARLTRIKRGLWRHSEPRPWASLEVFFEPKMDFGVPGDPEGVLRQDGPRICPARLVFRSTA